MPEGALSSGVKAASPQLCSDGQMFSLWPGVSQAAKLSIIKIPDQGAHVCPLPGSRREAAWIMQTFALFLLHLYDVRPMNVRSAFSDACGL